MCISITVACLSSYGGIVLLVVRGVSKGDSINQSVIMIIIAQANRTLIRLLLHLATIIYDYDDARR